MTTPLKTGWTMPIADAIAIRVSAHATDAIQTHIRYIRTHIEHSNRRDGDATTLAHSYVSIYP